MAMKDGGVSLLSVRNAKRAQTGIYTVRELRDNTVAMGLRFCLHEVVVKNRDQFATFF